MKIYNLPHIHSLFKRLWKLDLPVKYKIPCRQFHNGAIFAVRRTHLQEACGCGLISPNQIYYATYCSTDHTLCCNYRRNGSIRNFIQTVSLTVSGLTTPDIDTRTPTLATHSLDCHLDISVVQTNSEKAYLWATIIPRYRQTIKECLDYFENMIELFHTNYFPAFG